MTAHKVNWACCPVRRHLSPKVAACSSLTLKNPVLHCSLLWLALVFNYYSFIGCDVTGAGRFANPLRAVEKSVTTVHCSFSIEFGEWLIAIWQVDCHLIFVLVMLSLFIKCNNLCSLVKYNECCNDFCLSHNQAFCSVSGIQPMLKSNIGSKSMELDQQLHVWFCTLII